MGSLIPPVERQKSTWQDKLKLLAPLGLALSGGQGIGGALGAFGVGTMAGEAQTKLSQWKDERKNKMEQENLQVEAAHKLYSELQGLNLNDVLSQETDPEKRRILQGATDKLAQLGQKWADFLSPESEGGSVVTPREAGDFMIAAQTAKAQIDAARDAARRKGEKEAVGLSAEKYKGMYGAMYGARAEAEPKVDVGGKEVPLSQAIANLRLQTEQARLARTQAGGAGGGEVKIRQAIAINAAKVLPMMIMQMGSKKQKLNDPDPAVRQKAQTDLAALKANYDSFIAELLRLGVSPEQITGGGAPTGAEPIDFGGGVTGVEEPDF